MLLIPFVSFAICYSLMQPLAPQSSIIAIILLITLITTAFKNQLKIPIETLPYLAMPIILFASINEKLEFASDDMILCFSMFAATLLVFSQKEIYSKWIFRSVIICGNMHLIMQIFGAIINNETVAIRSIFPLANEIMFFYMLLMFCSILIYRKDSNAFWRIYAIAIGALASISLVVGDDIYTKILKISGEDALGIWLGLGCGIIFTTALFLWKKFSLPKNLGISFVASIFLALMFSSIIAVNSNFFSSDSPPEATSRLDNWKAAWNLIKEKPLGVGFGAYGANSMQHWPTIEEAYLKHGATVYTSTHNQYLQILTEIGWPGFFYYCALFAIPWFVSIFRYLKTGKPHFLFIAGILASMLSVMEVAEAISMFAFIQIIHWVFLLYCVKAILPLRTERSFVITGLTRNLFFIILIPLLSFLLYDRGKQLYSMHLTILENASFSNRKELFLNMAPINRAFEIYPKNSAALWHIALMHLQQKNYEEALKAMDAVEEMSGYSWPVSQGRAEIYFEMGDLERACEAARFPIARFSDAWTLELEKKLGCEGY